MRRINQKRVNAIVEQTTRNALNEQQLNESGLVKGLWNGAKTLFKGAGRALGFGAKRTQRVADMAQDLARSNAAKFGNVSAFGNAANMERALNNYTASLGRANRLTQDAQRLAANSARARGLGLGLLGGGVLGASIAGGGGGTTPQPNGMPPMGGGYADPYAGAYGGYSDPYAGYYGGGYSGGYSDPYAGYYGGGYSDPYAGYYGGGSSGGDMDPMMLMYLMNQNGDSGGMDPAMIWALGGYT